MSERCFPDEQVDAQLTADQLKELINRWLQAQGQRGLWIVDDMPSGARGEDEVGALMAWLGPPNVRSLVTTRSRAYELGKRVDLGVLSKDESMKLLTRDVKPKGDAEQAAARTIIERLGQHALALDVAAASMSSMVGERPFQSFLIWLDDEADGEDSLSTIANELAGQLPNGKEVDVAKVLLRSINALTEDARDVLRLASCLAPAPIPDDLMVGVLAEANGISSEAGDGGQSEAALQLSSIERRLASALQDARSRSLLERLDKKSDEPDKKRGINVHVLVSRSVAKNAEDASRCEALRAAAVRVLEPSALGGQGRSHAWAAHVRVASRSSPGRPPRGRGDVRAGRLGRKRRLLRRPPPRRPRPPGTGPRRLPPDPRGRPPLDPDLDE